MRCKEHGASTVGCLDKADLLEVAEKAVAAGLHKKKKKEKKKEKSKTNKKGGGGRTKEQNDRISDAYMLLIDFLCRFHVNSTEVVNSSGTAVGGALDLAV